jgi:hypothetical protein
MSDTRKRPCCICRHWFRPDPRVGARQRACRKPECQTVRRRRTQARWRAANPAYAVAYRIDRRNTQKPPPELLRVPAPLTRLPWDLVKDEFGAKGADFLGVVSTLLLRSAKDQFQAYRREQAGVPGTLPPSTAKDQMRSPPY